MSDNRKYYYLKLKENFYNSETMVILESMQDGLLYSNLLLKMYLMSLKSGGILMLGDHLPHTPQTIATFTRHQVGTVERALKVFLEFGLVEILTDGAYYMADIQLLIGQSSTEGERKKKERMRLKRQKLLPSGGADICPPYSRGDICPPEIRDKSSENREQSIDTSSNEEVCKSPGSVRATIPYRQIQEMFNSICAHFPKCQALSDRRKKAIKARFENGMTVDDFKKLFEKAEASSFLRGKNDRDWQASFDWLIKDANMVKVLDGNYDNRGGNDYGRNVGAQAAGRNSDGRFEEIPGGVQL